MARFKITWQTTEADTGRPFTCVSVVEAAEEKDLALVPGQISEPVADDAPLLGWRTVE